MRTRFLSALLAVAGAALWLAASPAANAQIACATAQTPFYDAGGQALRCIGNETICATGEEPAFDAASQAILCLPARDVDAPPQPQPLCPTGWAAMRQGGALRCVEARHAASLSCQPPYRVFDTAGVCQWACAQGTLPDEQSGECTCRAGMAETGVDAYGRRVCQADPRQQSATPVLDPDQIPQPGERPELLQ